MRHSIKRIPVFEQGLHDATEAIDHLIDVAGGPTALGIRVGTSGQSITNLRSAHRVSNAVLAHRMADVAADLGEASITSRVLSGVDAWTRANRRGSGQGRRGPRGASGGAAPTSSRCRGADAALAAAPANQLYVVRDRMVGTRRA